MGKRKATYDWFDDHCPVTNKLRMTKKKAQYKASAVTPNSTDVKSLRYYKCPHCKDFHLTSKELF